MNSKISLIVACLAFNVFAIPYSFGLQQGKSSRQVDILYEAKSFRSGSQNLDKSVDRFTVKNTFKFQLNKKNKVTLVMPWAKANLKASGNGSVTKDSVEGFKDLKIVHEMSTQKAKVGLDGVKWKFKLNLPNGKEQLNASENNVTSAMGETGQGFSDPTYGKGLNLGVDFNLINKPTKSITNNYTFGYTMNGSYSSLFGRASYKKPGDNLVFNYMRNIKRNKKTKWSYGFGTNFTRRTVNFRPGGATSTNPSRFEGNVQLKYEKQRSKKLKEIMALKFQERGEIEVQESNGQIVRTEQGDRWTFNWTFNKKLNKKLSENYGLLGIFGGANDNLEVIAPNVGNATAKVGKDRNTRMEEVQLLYGRKYTINKHRQWFYNATFGITDDSRDYTIGGGYIWKF